MIHHPSANYIRYLFSKRTRDIGSIIEHLGDIGLPVPRDTAGVAEFSDMLHADRDRMDIPPGFNPLDDEMTSGTEKFLSFWKIHDMWRGTPHTVRAEELLENPVERRMIETMLLGPMSLGSIARHVRKRFDSTDSEMNTQVVRAFSHYFWDYNALHTEQWKTLFMEWTPSFNDDYRTALLAPRTGAGAALAISAADRGGEPLSSVAQYSTIRDHGFRMFMQHALLNNPSLSRTQGALYALQIVNVAEEELDKRRGGSADLLDELRKIEVEYDRSEMRKVQDLPSIRDPSLIEPNIIDATGTEVSDGSES